MMNKLDTKKILQKYNAGEKLSRQEILWLDSFYLHKAKQSKHKISDSDLANNLAQVDASMRQQIPKKRFGSHHIWWYAAASAVIAVAFALYSYQLGSTNRLIAEQRTLLENIKPGSDKAILELANGEQVILDGTQTLHHGASTIALSDKTIDLQKLGIHATALNTIRIPRGGQYKVVLSDGSTVWLNAGSQLRYPNVFAADSRRVELIGEAYFEVSHNPNKPFMVKTKDQQIQVLGTGFNVRAYPNSPSATTLAHGKVQVTASQAVQPLLLHPGEQAFLDKGSLHRKRVNVNSAMAWKNGLFSFQRSDLRDITAQLERWYDVDFVFENMTIPSKQITGEISRHVSLYDVVEILSYFDISCRIEGRTVYLDVKNNKTK
ncbi:DUF4974 domain-containing protein [Sphingobacterium alkalisoli]|uniref:DUF4974 domain-containing protein n=1 Tax=Sphingobacterium alkalisoli TaxID=1874115 RepID=A0A4U0H3A7_9SPHI|nr:FecR family protein [Sphingobacterium alkalisoli]TJY66018.1 DUF4974 domain-containing protein [Sphingobacterium alkalisoli]GGH16794.1 iron dicitrate transporter FecR [Sphingobacterium alkalisoli]